MLFLLDAHRRRVPAQNVERSICIGVDMEAAMPTDKDCLAFAALSVNGSAFRTGLRCVCGIDLAQVSAAFFELVGKDGLEAEPALIEDRAVQCGLLPDHTARFSTVPLAEVVMFLMRKSSRTTVPKRLARLSAVLCAQSRRMRDRQAESFAARLSAFARRTEPRLRRATMCCAARWRRSMASSERGTDMRAPVGMSSA